MLIDSTENRQHTGVRRRMVRTVLLCAFCITAYMLTASCAPSSDTAVDTIKRFDATELTEKDAPDVDEEEADTAVGTPQQSPTTTTGVVVIDAGHQGKGDSTQEPVGPGASETKARVTSGTSGVNTGIAEHEVNLSVAFKLRDELEARGITVIMVRESADVNISNSERATLANNAGADLVIRLHCDGDEDSSSNGFSTLVPGTNKWTAAIVDESRRAAEYIHTTSLAATGAHDKGIVERTDLSGFNWSTVPSILCEMGFLSNAEEEAKLVSDEYQLKIAEGIADGTVQYLGGEDT